MNNNNNNAFLSKELHECFEQGILADQRHMDTSKVVYFLVSESEFQKHMAHLPHVPYYDMVIVFAYMTTSEHLNSFLLITNKLAESNHLSVPNLVDLAQHNTHLLFPSSTVSFGKFMFDRHISSNDISPEKLMQYALVAAIEEKDPKTAAYILSAKNYKFGATALLDISFLDRMANELENDLIILPSSDGEFLINTESQCDDLHELRRFTDAALRCGNAKILTRLIFRYSRKSRQLQKIS